MPASYPNGICRSDGFFHRLMHLPTKPRQFRWRALKGTISSGSLETAIVTARCRPEDAQSVPISLSVVDSDTLDKTSTYNMSQITQLIPSLNYVSPNPRNTAYTIRGLGSSVVAVS